MSSLDSVTDDAERLERTNQERNVWPVPSRRRTPELVPFMEVLEETREEEL